MAKKLLDEQSKESLRENFKLLKAPVTLALFTQKGPNDQYNEIVEELVREITSLHDKLKAELHPIGGELAKKYGVERSPTLMISPEKYNIRFTGSPLGEEGRTLIMAIIMASTGNPALAEDSIKRLERLKEKRHVRVFVSPT